MNRKPDELRTQLNRGETHTYQNENADENSVRYVNKDTYEEIPVIVHNVTNENEDRHQSYEEPLNNGDFDERENNGEYLTLNDVKEDIINREGFENSSSV